MSRLSETKRRTHNSKKEKRKKMQEASDKMDAVAKKLGKWDPETTIRKFRDANLKSQS